MIQRIGLIAQFTLREAIRRKVIVGTLLLTLAFLLLYTLGVGYAYRLLDNPANFRRPPDPEVRMTTGIYLGLMGIYVTNMIGALLTILTSVGSISGEIDAGTLQAILPKPIRRYEFVIGRWFGFAAMLMIYVTVITLAVIAVVGIFGNYIPPNVLPALGLILLSTLLLLSLAMLSTTFLSTITAGIVVFMLYAIAASGGLMELIGSLIRNDALVNMGIISSLIVPSDVLYRYAADLRTPNIGLLQGPAILFGSGSEPSSAMIVYAAIYVIVILTIAVGIFQRRDI